MLIDKIINNFMLDIIGYFPNVKVFLLFALLNRKYYVTDTRTLAFLKRDASEAF